MIDNLRELLPYLAGGTGMAVWMLFVSNTLKNWRQSPDDMGKVAQWIRGLTSFQLLLLVGVASGSLPIAAYVTNQTVSPEFLDMLQPHFAFLVLLCTVFLAQQGVYQVTKDN